MQRSVQFGGAVLQVLEEDRFLVGGVLVDALVLVQRALGEVARTSADQVHDRGTLELHGLVLVAGRRSLQVVQVRVGPVERVVVVAVELLQVDGTRVVGSVEAVHVERLAAVQGLVGAGGLHRARVGQRRLRRRGYVVDDRNVDRGRVERFAFGLLLVQLSGQGLGAGLVVLLLLLHVRGRSVAVVSVGG